MHSVKSKKSSIPAALSSVKRLKMKNCPKISAAISNPKNTTTEKSLSRFTEPQPSEVSYLSKIAICPGSFDPITKGHLDIIRRSAKIFDKVIVVVMSNYRKTGSSLFTVEERVGLIERCTSDLPNVEVDFYMGLLAEYARQKNAAVIIKGLRAVSDFEDEFQQALANKSLNPDVETVFMAASAENMFLSSSVIKQICQLGGDVTPFLPPEISGDIISKLRQQ